MWNQAKREKVRQFNNLQHAPQGNRYDPAHTFPYLLLEFPMSLNRDQINSIAHLARLSLTDAEVPVYQDSLSKIVDLVGQLEAAETAGIEPMAHPLPGSRNACGPTS
jgi:hypothetical protein